MVRDMTLLKKASGFLQGWLLLCLSGQGGRRASMGTILHFSRTLFRGRYHSTTEESFGLSTEKGKFVIMDNKSRISSIQIVGQSGSLGFLFGWIFPLCASLGWLYIRGFANYLRDLESIVTCVVSVSSRACLILAIVCPYLLCFEE